MLLISAAALLGVALGCFFKVAVLAPGVATTTVVTLLVEWSSGVGGLAVLAAVALTAVSLQFGYFVGSQTARSFSRPHGFHSSRPTTGKLSADF